MSIGRSARSACAALACGVLIWEPTAAEAATEFTDCDITGEWRGAGEFPRPDGAVAPHAFITNSEGAREGSLSKFSIPHRGVVFDIPSVACKDGAIETSFSLSDSSVQLRLAADGEQMEGALVTGGETYPFTLRRIDPHNTPALNRGAEFLTDDRGRHFVLGVSGKAITFHETETNQVRRFYPLAPDGDYASGAHIRALDPVTAQLGLPDHDGGEFTLRRSEVNKTLRRTEAFKRSPITFSGGDGVSLAGELLIPTGGNTAPGVVVIAGSGQQDRWGFGALQAWKAVRLAEAGFAVLVFDKRGVGESGGDYEARDFEILAEDSAKAVEFLAGQPGVDPARTGALVHSQSGMYGGMIAARTDALKFLVALGPSITNGKIQEIQRTADTILADGYPLEDAASASALQILKFHYADYRLSWDAYALHRAALEDAPWFDTIVGPPDDPALEVWDFWRAINAYEPAQDYARMQIPVLVLYGEHDVISPVEPSMALLRQAFSGERSTLLDIAIVEGANHALYLAEDGGVIAEASISSVSPFMQMAIDWLAARGFAP